MIDTRDMTLQEVSDAVAAAVIKQGRQCANNKGACQYSDPVNPDVHCAVGWLLPEDSPLMKFTGSLDSLIHYADDNDIPLGLNHGILANNYRFTTILQEAHDSRNGGTLDNWLTLLNRVFKINTEAWEGWKAIVEAAHEERNS